MTLKDLLVMVSDDAASGQRMEYALDMAARFDADALTQSGVTESTVGLGWTPDDPHMLFR